MIQKLKNYKDLSLALDELCNRRVAVQWTLGIPFVSSGLKAYEITSVHGLRNQMLYSYILINYQKFQLDEKKNFLPQ